MNHFKTLILGCSVSALSLPAGVLAQTSESEEDYVVLSSFTVFGDHYDTIGAATRLPLSERETPQSISLIDSSRLEHESMFSMDDVMRNVTGVNVSLYDTQRPLYFSRGFQITDFQVDGIPTYSNDTNQEYDTALYQRVEILRGANGLFSGSGEPSGTVNFHRKQAERSFAASVRQTVGSWDYYRTEVDVNTPLSSEGQYRGRVVAAYTDRDSFRDRYHEDKLALLATFTGDITDTTSLTFGYQTQDNDPTASVWGTIPYFSADGSTSDLPHTTNFATNWAKWQRESNTAFVNLEQQFGSDWQLKAAYNHTTGDVVSKSVYQNTYGGSWLDKEDGSGVMLSGTYWDGDDVRDSLDLYTNGVFRLFEREHDLVFGASYSEYEGVSRNNDAGYTWTYFIPNFYTWDGSAPELTFNYLDSYTIEQTEQLGVYASTRLRLTDSLSAILGGRISNWDTKEFQRDIDGVVTSVSSEYDVDGEFTPYIGFTYDLNQNTTLYASYTSIFEPQSYVDENGAILDPVEGTNLEVGIKSSFADGRATFTAALFEASQDNYAVRDPSYIDPLPNGKYVYYGVDGTKSEGVELQLSGQVNQDWSVIFGYTLNDTSRHETDLIWTNLPKHLFQFSSHYQFPGKWRRLAIGGGLTWQSEIQGSSTHPTEGSAIVTQDAYALANIHLNYEFNENFSATLSAKNAFDEIYLANLDYPNYGEPRNVIFSLKWKY
ncbi:TonB-dependent siderophore receptor [Pelagicoccus sp. SDUM812003]|uniref:TonB-dependent siderophore receptor n=1 Tax=Pelagicoccus sp. SDUM812003 TaxID=3041267 RepID=UPI00280FAEE3|nr:TonB-dependent siderophore receptor [Pelagicoccus sp. SDUM812003]MDQ8202584.1 TonB-dependent siderophore receptor [Pelagicoccus sp. SDUM812003]